MNEAMTVAQARKIFKAARLFGFMATVDLLEKLQKAGVSVTHIGMDITPLNVEPLSASALLFSPRLRLGYKNQTPLETLVIFADYAQSPEYDEKAKKAFRRINETLTKYVRAEKEIAAKERKANRLLKARAKLHAQKDTIALRRNRKEIRILGFGVRNTPTGSKLTSVPLDKGIKKRKLSDFLKS